MCASQMCFLFFNMRHKTKKGGEVVPPGIFQSISSARKEECSSIDTMCVRDETALGALQKKLCRYNSFAVGKKRVLFSLLSCFAFSLVDGYRCSWPCGRSLTRNKRRRRKGTQDDNGLF